MCVLTDTELGTVGKAFERAWDNCLKAGLVTRQNLFEMRRLLAARILRCAYYGQKDEWRLARDALSYIHELGLNRCSSAATDVRGMSAATASRDQMGINRVLIG